MRFSVLQFLNIRAVVCSLFESRPCRILRTKAIILSRVCVWLQAGFGLEMGFIDHIQVVTTSNHNTIAFFNILEITTAHANSFQSAVFTSRSLVTDSNSGDTSTAPTKSSLRRLPYNSDELQGRFTSRLVIQFVLAPSPLRLTTSNFFQLNTCFHSPYVTSSLTRGWVRSL
jgi:hypothetical protein